MAWKTGKIYKAKVSTAMGSFAHERTVIQDLALQSQLRRNEYLRSVAESFLKTT